MSQPPSWRDRFVQHLESLATAEDRAALARLRRGLGKAPASVYEVYPIVQPWLPVDLPRWDQEAAYLIASLFAAHPYTGGRGSLGRAFTELAQARKARRRDSDSLEKRFVALLNSHRDDLPEHLRHAVSLLAAEPVALDWRQLLDDVRHWSHPDRFVQRRWARDYWSAGVSTAAEPAES